MKNKIIYSRHFLRVVLVTSLLFSICISSFAFANDKRYDIRINPVTWIVGAYDLEANIAVARKFMLGPTYSFWRGKYKNHNAELQRYGLRLNAYFSDPFHSGPYISTFYHWVVLDAAERHDTFGHITGRGYINYYGLFAGYRWHGEVTNINFGLGYANVALKSFTLDDAYGVNRETVKPSDVSWLNGIAVDFTIGRSF